MVVLNLYFIKEANGLYYYAKQLEQVLIDKKIEYKIVSNKRSIFASPAGKEKFSKEILSLNVIEFLLLYFRFSRKCLFITPTFHPLPFIKKQIVIFHDNFPYLGTVGQIKKHIIKSILSLSDSYVGFVNRSKATKFLDDENIPNSRRIYLPNTFNFEKMLSAKKLEIKFENIGLAGTDSPKKNYYEFFSIIQKRGLKHSFFIYGNKTKYLQKIISLFPGININFVDANICSPENFMTQISCLAQVNTDEGFGRINAVALGSGVPVLALDCPVMREYFEEDICHYPTIDELVFNLEQGFIKEPNASRVRKKNEARRFDFEKNLYHILCRVGF